MMVQAWAMLLATLSCSDSRPPRTSHTTAQELRRTTRLSSNTPPENCWQRFGALDADSNGLVTEREFRNMPDPQMSLDFLFSERDLDRDGSLTRYEFCSSGAP